MDQQQHWVDVRHHPITARPDSAAGRPLDRFRFQYHWTDKIRPTRLLEQMAKLDVSPRRGNGVDDLHRGPSPADRAMTWFYLRSPDSTPCSHLDVLHLQTLKYEWQKWKIPQLKQPTWMTLHNFSHYYSWANFEVFHSEGENSAAIFVNFDIGM